MLRTLLSTFVALTVAVTVALFAPPQAADAAAPGTLGQASSARTTELTREAEREPSPRAWMVMRHSANRLSEGGCGFLQRCVYLNQADQKAWLTASSAVLIAELCLLGGPACIAAAAIVGLAKGYLGDHGVCSGTKKLRVPYFRPGAPACVS
jgi:hypothetical protein